MKTSAPDKADPLVVFRLDDWRCALRLATVERIFPAVEMVALPKAPEIVQGVIEVQGRVVAVVNVRKRFHLPQRDMSLSDHLILARTSTRAVGLVVDGVLGVVEPSAEEMTPADKILSKLEFMEGVVKLDDGLVFIHNLDTFLSLEEEKALEQAMMPTQ